MTRIMNSSDGRVSIKCKKHVTFSKFEDAKHESIPNVTFPIKHKVANSLSEPFKHLPKESNVSSKRCRKIYNGKCEKVLIRNTEQVVTNKNFNKNMVGKTTAERVPIVGETRINVDDTKSEYKARYGAPELYSTLSLAKEMQGFSNACKKATTMQTTRTVQNKGAVNIPEMSTVSRQIVEGKVTNKLNFPAEEHLYKDLVNLNIRAKVYKNPVKKKHSPKIMPRVEESYLFNPGTELRAKKFLVTCPIQPLECPPKPTAIRFTSEDASTVSVQTRRSKFGGDWFHHGDSTDSEDCEVDDECDSETGGSQVDETEENDDSRLSKYIARQISKNSDGSQVSKNCDGSQVYKNGGGSWVSKNGNGTFSQISKNGDGSLVSKSCDGSQVSKNDGGSWISKNGDGSQVSKNGGSSWVSKNGDGTCSQISKNDGGSRISKNCDGSQVSKNYGGSQVSSNNFHSQVSKNFDGSQVSINYDCMKASKNSEDSLESQKYDGSQISKNDGGNQVSKNYYGSRASEIDDCEVFKTYDSYSVSKNVGGSHAFQYHDSSMLYENSQVCKVDGSSLFCKRFEMNMVSKNCNGSQVSKSYNSQLDKDGREFDKESYDGSEDDEVNALGYEDLRYDVHKGNS